MSGCLCSWNVREFLLVNILEKYPSLKTKGRYEDNIKTEFSEVAEGILQVVSIIISLYFLPYSSYRGNI
jgi:hypothetical protein